jgi:hypothetical protein
MQNARVAAASVRGAVSRPGHLSSWRAAQDQPRGRMAGAGWGARPVGTLRRVVGRDGARVEPAVAVKPAAGLAQSAGPPPRPVNVGMHSATTGCTATPPPSSKTNAFLL